MPHSSGAKGRKGSHSTGTFNCIITSDQQRPQQLANGQNICPQLLCVIKPTLTEQQYKSLSKGAATFYETQDQRPHPPRERSAHKSRLLKAHISQILCIWSPQKERSHCPQRTGYLFLPITIYLQQARNLETLCLTLRTKMRHVRTHNIPFFPGLIGNS